MALPVEESVASTPYASISLPVFDLDHLTLRAWDRSVSAWKLWLCACETGHRKMEASAWLRYERTRMDLPLLASSPMWVAGGTE